MDEAVPVPTRQDLLRLRLNAATRDSERLQVLSKCLVMSVQGMQQELMDVHDWSELDSTIVLNDALQAIGAELFDAALS